MDCWKDIVSGRSIICIFFYLKNVKEVMFLESLPRKLVIFAWTLMVLPCSYSIKASPMV
jgi:hypothetical protein